MGGNSGGIIVQHAVKATLTDVTVHGQLPPKTQAMVDPILAKDQATWSARDKKDLAAAFTWALCTLN
jgi:hypothetical protein